MTAVGRQQCLDQCSLLLTQLLSCLPCPSLGLPCPSLGQGFCRQDHCPGERCGTAVKASPRWGRPHTLHREGCGKEAS